MAGMQGMPGTTGMAGMTGMMPFLNPAVLSMMSQAFAAGHAAAAVTGHAAVGATTSALSKAGGVGAMVSHHKSDSLAVQSAAAAAGASEVAPAVAARFCAHSTHVGTQPKGLLLQRQVQQVAECAPAFPFAAAEGELGYGHCGQDKWLAFHLCSGGQQVCCPAKVRTIGVHVASQVHSLHPQDVCTTHNSDGRGVFSGCSPYSTIQRQH